LNGEEKFTRINNIHMEEDAGKSIHDERLGKSLVDFNRCGVPLIEIVTEPDITSAEEAVLTLSAIKETLSAIGVSDCKMQEGSLRCDVNISVKPHGSEKLGTRTEMKNLNSFKAVARAIEFEANRQIEVIENGGKIRQITLKWNDAKGENEPLRSKEESNDYRYFPDPDLLPVDIEESYIQKIKSSLPELPYDRRNRYITKLGLSSHDAEIITASSVVTEFFEECLKLKNEPKFVANWVMTDIMRKLKESLLDEPTITISAKNFVELITMFQNSEISINNAREILDKIWDTNESAVKLAEELGLKQVNDESEVKNFVLEIISANPQAVSDFKAGNQRALTFFVGQVMKHTKGKANPQIVNKILLEELNK
jgi:aspartyl-tRNA(Asn)/glutamyl-tRNA(Gln) amidotransferase subunit B